MFANIFSSSLLLHRGYYLKCSWLSLLSWWWLKEIREKKLPSSHKFLERSTDPQFSLKLKTNSFNGLLIFLSQTFLWYHLTMVSSGNKFHFWTRDSWKGLMTINVLLRNDSCKNLKILLQEHFCCHLRTVEFWILNISWQSLSSWSEDMHHVDQQHLCFCIQNKEGGQSDGIYKQAN